MAAPALAPRGSLKANAHLTRAKAGRNITTERFDRLYAEPVRRGNYAVLAFNARNFPLKKGEAWEEGYVGPSTVVPVLKAARALQAPVLIEIAGSELGKLEAPYTGVLSRYGFDAAGIQAGLNNFVQHVFAEYARLDMTGIPIGVHYDHGNRADIRDAAIRAGFTSVALDGGNIKDMAELHRTGREWVNVCRPFGVGVEGEIELVDVEAPTKPAEAVAFAKATGIDVLVVTLALIFGVRGLALSLSQDNVIFIPPKETQPLPSCSDIC